MKSARASQSLSESQVLINGGKYLLLWSGATVGAKFRAKERLARISTRDFLPMNADQNTDNERKQFCKHCDPIILIYTERFSQRSIPRFCITRVTGNDFKLSQ